MCGEKLIFLCSLLSVQRININIRIPRKHIASVKAKADNYEHYYNVKKIKRIVP